MILEEVKIWYECAECSATITTTSYARKTLEEHMKFLDVKCSHCHPLESYMRMVRLTAIRAQERSKIKYWGTCRICGATATNEVEIPDDRVSAALGSEDLDGFARCKICHGNTVTVMRVTCVE